MQTPQDASYIDCREFRQRLPYLSDNDIASELDTGRLATFVRNCGGYEERELPRSYDREADAWVVDWAQARADRLLFWSEQVCQLEGRHPEALPEPSRFFSLTPPAGAYVDLETDPDIAAMYARGELEDALRRAFATIDRQKAELAEKDKRLAELEAELAKVQGQPCIGDGFRRLACDLLRRGLPRAEAARMLASEGNRKVSHAGIFYLFGNDEDAQAALKRLTGEDKARSDTGKRILQGAKRRTTPDHP